MVQAIAVPILAWPICHGNADAGRSYGKSAMFYYFPGNIQCLRVYFY